MHTCLKYIYENNVELLFNSKCNIKFIITFWRLATVREVIRIRAPIRAQ